MNYREWQNSCHSYLPVCTCFLWCIASFSHLVFSHNLCGPALLPSFPLAPVPFPCTAGPALPIKTKRVKPTFRKKNHAIHSDRSYNLKCKRIQRMMTPNLEVSFLHLLLVLLILNLPQISFHLGSLFILEIGLDLLFSGHTSALILTSLLMLPDFGKCSLVQAAWHAAPLAHGVLEIKSKVNQSSCKRLKSADINIYIFLIIQGFMWLTVCVYS